MLRSCRLHLRYSGRSQIDPLESMVSVRFLDNCLHRNHTKIYIPYIFVVLEDLNGDLASVSLFVVNSF